jgi:hypothetical protein
VTDEEFRYDLLASAASRADTSAMGAREAFVSEIAERLRDASELPDLELCPESVTGNRNRKLEVDAFAFDEADDSLNLAIAIRDGRDDEPTTITLSDARDVGFNRLEGVFDQARSGWLTQNIEESRPLWSLAKRIQSEGLPAALRLHVFTDRPISERLREIPEGITREGVPITYQIWDLTRLKRIQEAQSVRDDLIIDLSTLPGGGLPVLPAAIGGGDYDAYLAVIPGEALADIYLRHGSRLLEGNVRTFLGRRGNINKGIGNTLAKEPSRFFAYNNGIAATASGVVLNGSAGNGLLLTEITDLQIVNGAQTTASLAALRREKKLPDACVFVPMKLSVVSSDLAETLIPKISRYSNSQNAVRASDFFANHEFHRRIEQISRRVLAPAISGSQVQTHWYYERARGQYLNDQAGLTAAKRDQFVRLNPRNQVITKTNLAKVETCFDQMPDLACRGAEKAFIAFADRITKAWQDERNRSLYGDDWFRAAVARTILFQTAERLVSKAPWYAPGTRAQVVAHTTARLSLLAEEVSGGGKLDYLKIWSRQSAGDVLEQQILNIAEMVMEALLTPPQAGQNVGEWAKQQACKKRIFETTVSVVKGFEAFLVDPADASSEERSQRDEQRVTDGLAAVTEVISLGGPYWDRVRVFARTNGLLTPEDDKALEVVCKAPRRVPNDYQASRAVAVKRRCEESGFSVAATGDRDTN